MKQIVNYSAFRSAKLFPSMLTKMLRELNELAPLSSSIGRIQFELLLLVEVYSVKLVLDEETTTLYALEISMPNY